MPYSITCLRDDPAIFPQTGGFRRDSVEDAISLAKQKEAEGYEVTIVNISTGKKVIY